MGMRQLEALVTRPALVAGTVGALGGFWIDGAKLAVLGAIVAFFLGKSLRSVARTVDTETAKQ